jgi:hypothetical protein
MLLGLLFARKRDQRDELNIEKIKIKQKKIYVNLYLEPIQDIRKKGPDEEVVKKRYNDQYEEIVVNSPTKAAQ